MAKNTVYGLRDPERFVYHYTSAAVALDFILKDRTLQMNQVTATNDPREGKAWDFIGNGYVEGWFESDAREKISIELRRPVYVACFCSDATAVTGNHLDDVLLRGLAKPRMWAQYGGRHKGFCLIFDRAKLVSHAQKQFGSESIQSGLVTYRDCHVAPSLNPGPFRIEIPALQSFGVAEYCRRHRQVYMKGLFFEKLTDWQDEREWRLVLVAEREGLPLIEYGDALVGVVHGQDADEGDSEAAMELTADRDVEHLFLNWSNNGVWYVLDHELLRRRWFKKS